MIEIVCFVLAVLSLAFSIFNIWLGFYTCGIIVTFFVFLGILTGGIKYPLGIIAWVLISIIMSVIFKHDVFKNIIFVVCVENIYTFTRAIIKIRKFDKLIMKENGKG